MSLSLQSDTHGSRVLHARAGQPGQGERRESSTDVRLDGDEVAPDADDGDAGDATGSYMAVPGLIQAQWRRRVVFVPFEAGVFPRVGFREANA
jgi:hypothetical protein